MAQKISTGSPGLDEVLSGGIPANTITMLMGAPGTGKTILAEQCAFANATTDTPVLYLTTLSEPLEKFIVHGQTQSFFDSGKVGESIFYEDLGLNVRTQGVGKLAEMVADLFVQHRPKLVFIDSFKALTELLSTAQEKRTVIYDLATVLSSYQCTSILVGEYAEETMTELPEFAIADVVLRLLKYSTNVREQRFLKVEKLRGSDFSSGMHALTINGNGVKVFPRLLSPAVTPDYRVKVERVSTGIDGLDDLIAKGFWRGSTTLLAGPTGSGKTTIGLQFLVTGALKGEPGLYVNFQENPTQLVRMIDGFGWHPEKLLDGGGFELMYRSPVELQLDTVTVEVFRRVREGRIRRVVIDALGDLERSSIDRQRFADFVYALTQWFAVQNVTCLMTYELTNLFEVHGITDQEISNMSDNVMLLRFIEAPEMERTLRIIKTRGSAHDNREHFVEITNKGVSVRKPRK